MVKIRNFESFGAVFPCLCPRSKFHVYRGKMSSLQGEKPIFGSLSKKTIPAWLSSRRPAGNKINDFNGQREYMPAFTQYIGCCNYASVV